MKTAARITCLTVLAGMVLAGCATAPELAPAATEEAATVSAVELDPRSCYIDSVGTAVHPGSAALVCDNGSRLNRDAVRSGDTSAHVEVTAD